MAEAGETRSFPLKTIICIIKAKELVQQGINPIGVSTQEGREVLSHMYPGIIIQNQGIGKYIPNQFAALLSKVFPQLACKDVATVASRKKLSEWLRMMEKEFGETIDVPVVGKSR